MVNSAINFDFIISFSILKVFAVNNIRFHPTILRASGVRFVDRFSPYDYMNKQVSVGLATPREMLDTQRGGRNTP